MSEVEATARAAAPPRGGRLPVPTALAVLPAVAAGSVLYFIGDLAVQHVLRPSYDPVRAFVSAFVVGRYGSLQVVAFIALAIGLLCLAVGLRRALPTSMWLRAGVTLLLICAAATTVAAIFVTDLPGAAATASGIVHGVAGDIGYLALVGAMIATSLHFAGDQRWRRLFGWCAGLALLSVVMLAAMFLTLDTIIAGLTQRLFGLSTFAWVLLVSIALLQAVLAGHYGRLPAGTDTD
ncbi:MAG TPA: DUF998 domain-containing protein [Thermoleophilia bacterium]|nr:DUF998 domain-containing protein [Thermoleophilia bacterium]